MPTSDRTVWQPDGMSQACPLILASASPRRRELMERFWPEQLQVLVPSFDETAAMDRLAVRADTVATPGQLVLDLPAGKMAALQAGFKLPDVYCAVTADTIVVVEDQILGKPTDAAEAKTHLRLLSARDHHVLTGLCVQLQTAEEQIRLQAVEETVVWFAPLDEAIIDWYVQTGEPFDKAGSYGIQGAGAALVQRIDGCYYNVMGLPVYRLLSLLRQAADRVNSFSFFNHLLPWR